MRGWAACPAAAAKSWSTGPQADHAGQGPDRWLAGGETRLAPDGGVSSSTMMFGHVETLEERIEHLDRLRQLQDETHGFKAFICWTHQSPKIAPWFGKDAEEGRKGGVDMSSFRSRSV